MFYSLLGAIPRSSWRHLQGVAGEFQQLGHEVQPSLPDAEMGVSGKLQAQFGLHRHLEHNLQVRVVVLLRLRDRFCACEIYFAPVRQILSSSKVELRLSVRRWGPLAGQSTYINVHSVKLTNESETACCTSRKIPLERDGG